MPHLRSLDGLSTKQAWVTIGSFDGVHFGHQGMIRQMTQKAHAGGSPAVVVTFFPHPAVLLRNTPGPYYLTSPEERAKLLAGLGVDWVITLPFDLALANLPPFHFMELLQKHLNTRVLWVGSDFALGRDRMGNTAMLKKIGESLGYTLEIFPQVTLEGKIVSSSGIRKLLGQGKVKDAAALLGRWYNSSGNVVHGDGRGRGLGFPTANLKVWPDRLLPAAGVYATRSWLESKAYPSVTNVGYRPTFETGKPSPRVEAHLLNFDQNIYGCSLNLEYIHYIRPEQRFSSVQDLMGQVQKDIQTAREVLSYDS